VSVTERKKAHLVMKINAYLLPSNCICPCTGFEILLYDVRSCAGIARCFTFGGSRNRVLHDPAIQPRSVLSQENYMKKEEQTTLNHFYEKLLKLKDLMKTKVKKLGVLYIGT